MSICISKPYALLLSPNDFIDYQEGAVTLVNYRLEETAILVESATFQYFLRMAKRNIRHISHLRDPTPGYFTRSAKVHFSYVNQKACVIAEPVTEKHLANITKKSCTWLMHADIVTGFINKILIKEKGFYQGFSLIDYMESQIEVKDPILSAIRKVDPELFVHLFDSSQRTGVPMEWDRGTFDSKIKQALQIIRQTKNDNNNPIHQGKLLYISNKDAHLLNDDITYTSLIVKIGETVELPKWLIRENCIGWAIRHIESLGIVLENIDNQPFSTRVHSYTCYSKDSAQTIVRIPQLETEKLAEFTSFKQVLPLRPSNTSGTTIKDIKEEKSEEKYPDIIIKGIEEEESEEKSEILTYTLKAAAGFAAGILSWRRIKEPEGQIAAVLNVFTSLFVVRRVLQSVDNLKKLEKIKQDVINDLNDE